MEATPRTALVTGASGGIGAEICRALARSGTRVIATARRPETCESLLEELLVLSPGSRTVALDVTDPASVAEALAQVGPVDWVVNNAGWVQTAPIDRADEAHYADHLEVNFHGARRVLEVALAGLKERGGGVLQIASSASLQGYAYVTAYTAAKHALLGYSRSAALELTRSGVSVNVICPHYVDSPMTDANVSAMQSKTGKSEEELRAFLAAQNPGGVLVTPQEVADAAVELLNSRVTGRVLELVGGASNTIEQGWELE